MTSGKPAARGCGGSACTGSRSAVTTGQTKPSTGGIELVSSSAIPCRGTFLRPVEVRADDRAVEQDLRFRWKPEPDDQLPGGRDLERVANASLRPARNRRADHPGAHRIRDHAGARGRGLERRRPRHAGFELDRSRRDPPPSRRDQAPHESTIRSEPGPSVASNGTSPHLS